MSGATAVSDLQGVEVAGPPDGQPIVFVHGVMFTRKQWVPQREDMADEFRYVAMDLPGHGEWDDQDFRLEVAVDRLDEVIEAAADGSAAVVGLSLGGFVATEYASRYPEKVEALVISGSSFNPVGRLGTLTRVISTISEYATRVDAVDRAVTKLNERFVSSLDLGLETEAEIIEAGFFPDQFSKGGFEIADRDFRESFASFQGPAFILNGKWDLINRLGEKKHAKATSNAAAAAIPGAGHVCTLEKPDVYAAAVRRFIVANRREPLE